MDMPVLTAPVSPVGVDFSNRTQAFDFLMDILNDDTLMIEGNAYARAFWYGMAAAITVAAVFNIAGKLVARARLRDAALNKASPCRPKSLPARCFATLTALAREASYLQLSPSRRLPWLKTPPMGTLLLVLGYISWVLILEFRDNNMPGAQHWEAIGLRAGWLAVAQVPLLVLLVNKNNFIAFLTGVSYERLNVLHRWAARMLLFLALMHFGFQSYGWAKYGVTELEWTTDTCPPTGIIALGFLLWINLSTIAPFRNLSYEFFVAQHILSFFGFIIAIMYHIPPWTMVARQYIYIPIAAYLVDRIIRTMFFAWNNKRVARATLTQLDGNATMIRVSNKAITKWRPGSHVLLSIPRFGIFQNHPATIVSTPTSHGGDQVFVLKSHRGFTKKIWKGANSSTTAVTTYTANEATVEQSCNISTHLALLDGPYGGSQSDFAIFDSVLLISGSTGVTFTLSILQDIAERAQLSQQPLPLRRLHFVWCVKDINWAKWFDDEISAAFDKLDKAGIDVQVSIFVTRADGLSVNELESDAGSLASLTDAKPAAVVTSEKPLGLETSSQAVMPDRRLRSMPCACINSGRPHVRSLLTELLNNADGESGVAVCGPMSLTAEVRQQVVCLCDERAVHKGTGAQGCYLHVESTY